MAKQLAAKMVLALTLAAGGGFPGKFDGFAMVEGVMVNPANLPEINVCDHVTDASCEQMAVGFNMGSGWVKKQDGKLGHETLAIAGGTEIVEKCCTKTSNVNPANVNPSNVNPANLPGIPNACDHVTDASCAQMAVNFNMGGSGWVKNQDGKLGPETLAIAGKHDGHGGTEMVKKCCTNPNASSC